LTIAEVLAMSTGRDLLGTKPPRALNCWLVNLEDDRDELERRFMAACIHYRIDPEDVEGRLFLDSGRERELVIAVEHKRDGFKIMKPYVEAVIDNIRRHSIDVLVVDPFVSSHAVDENNNSLIDKVAKQWMRIADECNCAIEIVHHVRKGQADKETTIDDSRGAGSLLAAARSARVLNRMTPEQAQSAGVSADERFTIFGVQRGKSNLAPLTAQGEWRRLVSVPLGNGQGPMKPQDHAPVVTEWKWPTAEAVLEMVSEEQLEQIKIRINNTDAGANRQAADWGGHLVGEVMGMETESKEGKLAVQTIVDALVKAGDLTVVTDKDPVKGKSRPFLRVA
jgi:hypothetical protein